MELMARYPDNYFDLAIVDPPYGIGEDGLKNHSRSKLAKAKKYTPKKWDEQSPEIEYFDELQRISKNQIIFGANHFIQTMSASGYYINSSCWIVWNKLNTGDFADCELAWTSFKSAVRKFDFMWNGMLQQDMKNKEVRIHPTQKPVKLYEWLLMNYAKEGDKILDTHGGSMSIALAVHNVNSQDNMNLSLDLCELDKDYFDAGIKRLAQHQSQTTLF